MGEYFLKRRKILLQYLFRVSFIFLRLDEPVALPQLNIFHKGSLERLVSISLPLTEHTHIFIKTTLNNLIRHYFGERWDFFCSFGHVALVEKALRLQVFLSLPILSLVKRFRDRFTIFAQFIPLFLSLDLLKEVSLSKFVDVFVLDHVLVRTRFAE